MNMQACTNGRDVRQVPDRQAEVTVRVGRLDVMEAIARDATAHELGVMVRMLERRMSVIEQGRADRVVVDKVAAREAQEKMVDAAVSHFQRVLNITNVELAS